MWEGNPRDRITPAWQDFVDGWYACRGSMGGIGTWPDGGGTWDQAAWLVDAFHRLGAEEMRLRKLQGD